MNKRTILFVTGLLLAVDSASASGRQYKPNWESLDTRPVPEWFSNARFGIQAGIAVFKYGQYNRRESRVLHVK